MFRYRILVSGRELTRAKQRPSSVRIGVLVKARQNSHIETKICDPITRSRPQAGVGYWIQFLKLEQARNSVLFYKSTCASVQIYTCKAVNCSTVGNSGKHRNSWCSLVGSWSYKWWYIQPMEYFIGLKISEVYNSYELMWKYSQNIFINWKK